ncbi:helicase domain protein [Nitzschia inconspicua]|uniref:Helicase domain protein n=1 Tax=Nitzschia inconspicua TaxID=303405 RepID=A0A9K3K5M6_9STRA|nr:helicase domain protein [Nitzschia inconspicua]
MRVPRELRAAPTKRYYVRSIDRKISANRRAITSVFSIHRSRNSGKFITTLEFVNAPLPQIVASSSARSQNQKARCSTSYNPFQPRHQVKRNKMASSGLKNSYNEYGEVDDYAEPNKIIYTSDEDAEAVDIEQVNVKRDVRYELNKASNVSQRKTKKMAKSSAKKEIEPNQYDVYMGRGGLMNRFRNGSLYRTLIVQNFEGYQCSIFKRKFAIEKVIEPIMRKGGRFFVPTNDLKGWTEGNIEDVVAPKVMQALRDCKKEDGNKAGHIFSTPIRCTALNQIETSNAVGEKGTDKTSLKKTPVSNALTSLVGSPEKYSNAKALSFNHPSKITRKRASLSAPLGAPSPKIPKLRNEFGGIPAPSAPHDHVSSSISSPSFAAGGLRHNLLLSVSSKSSPATTQPGLFAPLKNESYKKIILLNENGYMMNTTHRTTGLCGFYHYLLSHHEPSFQRVSPEDEGRFAWENIVAPILKQGGSIHLCRTSGRVQQDVNHITTIAIAKALRNKTYIEEECKTHYFGSAAASVSPIISLNENGWVMNTMHRTTGVCRLYHDLLSHHEPSFQRVSPEDESRFVWENIVAPILKQRGSIHLCRTSGRVQHDVNHMTTIAIAKALRDKTYVEQERKTLYFGESSVSSIGNDDHQSFAEKGTGVGVTAISDIMTMVAGKSEDPKNPSMENANGLAGSVTDATTQAPLPPIDQTVPQHFQGEVPEFYLARGEVMKTLLVDGVIQGSDRNIKHAPIPLTKHDHGSYNSLLATVDARIDTTKNSPKAAVPKNANESMSFAGKRSSEGTTENSSSWNSSDIAAAEVESKNGTETPNTTELKSILHLAQDIKKGDRTCGDFKSKDTPVVTRKSLRSAVADNSRSTQRHAGNDLVATVTPEQKHSMRHSSSDGVGEEDTKSDDDELERKRKITWELRFKELKEYADKHGNCNVPQRCEENAALGRFVKINRQYWNRNHQGRKTCLTPEREARLDAIGFVWSMKDSQKKQRSYDWDQQLRSLKDYKKKKGHCDVPENDQKFQKLSRWVEYVRTLGQLDTESAKRRNGAYLTKKQKMELDGLGFDWKCEKTHRGVKSGQSPEVQTDDGKAKKNETGLVENDSENQSNNFQKKTRLKAQKNAGFFRSTYFESKIDKVRLQVPVPATFLNKFPPREKPPSPVSVVRNVSIDVNTAASAVNSSSAVQEIICDSNYGNNKDWDQCFKMLQCFQDENGHTQVPYKRFPHNHPLTVLSKFTHHMREQKVLKIRGQRNVLSDEREKLLRSIRFEWTTSFECTKEGTNPSKSKAKLMTSKLHSVAKAERKDSKPNGVAKRKVIVDSEGTRWTAYKPLAVDRLFNISKTSHSVPERPPTPENWGIELAYESDGSIDSLTF